MGRRFHHERGAKEISVISWTVSQCRLATVVVGYGRGDCAVRVRVPIYHGPSLTSPQRLGKRKGTWSARVLTGRSSRVCSTGNTRHICRRICIFPVKLLRGIVGTQERCGGRAGMRTSTKRQTTNGSHKGCVESGTRLTRWPP